MSGIATAARSRQGMVASSQALATQVGVEVLREGGSAVDAALATNAMLALTEPYMCGPGGDFFAMLWVPAEGRLRGINASGRASGARSLAAVREALGNERVMPMRGPLCVTVPGAVDGWCELHARYGRLPLSRVFGPAIAAARDGCTLGPATARGWALAVQEIAADPHARPQLAAFHALFAPDGVAPSAGARLRNPALADTFELIAREGRAGFYEGGMADALRTCLDRAGAPLAASDLAQVKADWVTPLATRYRGHEVHALPPNGQGATVLQILNLMQHAPAPAGVDDPAWWHWFIEAKKLAFADRARHYADPAFATVPVATLISSEYAAQRAQLIDPGRAAADFPPGLVPGTDTTCLAVADRDGMVVSAIQSIFNAFGSTLVVPTGGFALHSRGAGFSLDPAHPNAYAPGKRPFHTIIPGFVTRDGRPRFAFGVIGADMQPQGQVQVLSRILDFGHDAQQAGAAPRFRHVGGAMPNGERQENVLWYESGLPAQVTAGLLARGHQLRAITPAQGNFTGGYQGILCDAGRGEFEGGSDPRFDGAALGV